MKINLSYSTFIRIDNYPSHSVIEVPENCTVRDLFALLKLPSYLQKSITARINNEPSWVATVLKENDSVTLLRALGGG
jgi:sulfur carrier protein ThiS